MATTRVRGTYNTEQTRGALFEAAASLFSERGFDGATTEAIARRAQTNKAMIQYHFGNKAGLYRAILASGIDEISRVLDGVRRSELAPVEKLRAAAHAWVQVASERPYLPPLVMREILSSAQHIDGALLPRFLNAFASVRAIVEEGIETGDFRAVDPFLTHLSIAGSILFYFVSAPLRARVARDGQLPIATPSTDRFVAHLQAFLAAGLAAHDPSEKGNEHA